MSTRRATFGTRSGFTLLECMIALLLVSTALIIVVESQSFAVDVEERTARMNVATMLTREIMTELELRMVKEGFGELEVKESGDYSDSRYDGKFDEYRWEYEVEKVDLDQMPDLSMLMGLADEGTEAAGDALGADTSGGASNPLAMLSGLGIDLSFFSEYMGNYVREARARVCYPDGRDADGNPAEQCVELVEHMTNPTGQVADNSGDDDDDTGSGGAGGGAGGGGGPPSRQGLLGGGAGGGSP